MFEQYANVTGLEGYSFDPAKGQWYDVLNGLPVLDISGIDSGDNMLIENEFEQVEVTEGDNKPITGLYLNIESNPKNNIPKWDFLEQSKIILPREPTTHLLEEPSDQLKYLEEQSGQGKGWAIDGLESLIQGLNYQSDSAILSVFNAFGTGLIIDKHWALNLHKFVYGFTTKNEQYSEFFGSPYLGIYKVVFTSADRNQWFTDVFDVDEEELKENLHECKAVNKEWNVTSDPFNLSVVYILYRIYNSTLEAHLKRQAMIDVIAMYHYKCLTSIMANDYKYPARPEIAMETYNRLSMRYDIKRYGSWRALIQARAEFIIDPKTGIHFKTFTQMDDDKKIIYMVGDIQDRLRGVINDINKVFHDVKNKSNIVQIDEGMVKLEDGVGVREISKQVTQFKNYIISVLSGGAGFYKAELIRYACKDITNAPQDKLERIVKTFPEQYNHPKGKKYREFVDEVITHLFEYVTLNNIRFDNLSDVLKKMRGAYLSPRSQNQSVFKMRDLGDELVKDLTGIKTRITVTSLRTALMLYIVLRTLTMNAYN